MTKKILIVDDSAFMRRVLRDIIDADERFEVVKTANDGVEALDVLSKEQFDAVVLDVNMPKMNGLKLLEALRDKKIPARVMMASTLTSEDAPATIQALELGALDFVRKPDLSLDCNDPVFKQKMLDTLENVCNSKLPVFASPKAVTVNRENIEKIVDLSSRKPHAIKGDKIVAIASSTGGPKALQSVIPYLPENLDAPVVLVQHMPKGFMESLAKRLTETGNIPVTVAKEGEEIQKGHVYCAEGGLHMKIKNERGRMIIRYTDEPSREGVKPCANYMYESLSDSIYSDILCVVLTGMGADGTEGIGNLKKSKKICVLSQDEESSTIYGMPKSVFKAGLSDSVVPLSNMAQEIVLHVGVK